MAAFSFNYKKLSSSDAFRLLLLHPSRDSKAQVKCTLQHKTLSTYNYSLTEPYTALSYVWGETSNLRNIQVDASQVWVTKNLETALRCIRDKEYALLVWADAICINQTDIPEKGAQVRQMGLIYEHAAHTIIFLDESSRHLYSIVDEIKSLSGSNSVLRIDAVQRRPQSLSQDAISSLNFILSRPWFKRVWVLQELVLSRDPFIQCGTTRLRWDAFLEFAALARKLGEAPNFEILQTMSKFRKDFRRDESTVTLCELVLGRRGCGAADPRDIVYAQLGMTARDIEPDYNKSAAEVYAQMTHHMLLDNNNILGMVDYTAGNNLQLPTWVPDWSKVPPPNTGSKKRNARRRTEAFEASILHSAYEIWPDGINILSIDVQWVGEVDGIGSLVPHNLAQPEDMTASNYFLPELHLSVHRPGSINEIECLERGEQGLKRLLIAWATSMNLSMSAIMYLAPPSAQLDNNDDCFIPAYPSPNHSYTPKICLIYNEIWGPLVTAWARLVFMSTSSDFFAHRPLLCLTLLYLERNIVLDFWQGKLDRERFDSWSFHELTNHSIFSKVEYTPKHAERRSLITLVPAGAQFGDFVVFYGGTQGLVIRPATTLGLKTPRTYTVVGECFFGRDYAPRSEDWTRIKLC